MRKIVLLALAALSLSGCDKVANQCSTDDAKSVIVDIIKDNVQKSAGKMLNGNDPNAEGAIAPSTIRATISKLVFSIADIRTVKNDTESTSKDCRGTIEVKIPVEVINDANAARQSLSQNDVRAFADVSGLKVNVDRFTAEIAYKIQPTDDGKKIHGETESGSPFVAFVSEVVANQLASSVIQQAQMKQKQAEEQATAQQTAATEEQRKASLQYAQAEYKLAIQTNNAVWQAIDPNARSQIVSLQRAWVKKTDADCRVEAASASIEPTEMETARLNCLARENKNRAEYLRQYLPADE
jgi:uncharacterized protein YecT (DUF1311 family)